MRKALLTNTEIQWLTGTKIISNGYERKVKSNIKHKLQVFKELELPLLVQRGLLPIKDVTAFSNTVTAFSNTENLSTHSPHTNIEILAQNHSLERDLDPRPFPYQGNALPG